MIRGKARGPIEYYYVRPNRTVENGREGEDYFISTDAVTEYCSRFPEYLSSSSSESEVSPDPRSSRAAQFMETDEDDESTKVPAETDDDRSMYEYETPRDKGTKPQDPSKPQLPSDSESDVEDPRYEPWKLWARLRDNFGWKYVCAKNGFDSSWYIPEASCKELDSNKAAWKKMGQRHSLLLEHERHRGVHPHA